MILIYSYITLQAESKQIYIPDRTVQSERPGLLPFSTFEKEKTKYNNRSVSDRQTRPPPLI